MIATFDTETSGFLGRIRLIGWYDGQTYRVSTDANDWWDFASMSVVSDENDTPVWYAHNLDFDLGKLWKALPHLRTQIDWNKSIQINMRMVKVVFNNGVELHDSLTLLPGTLDSVLRSWGTEIGKLSSEALAKAGGYKDVDDYYCHVPVDDPDYLEYLRHDVMGLYEVLSRLHRFTGLSEADFCRKLTTASLAMKLYQTWFDSEYKALSKTKWREESDTSMRRAFFGGRTEVYGTHVENGFHYDVNSLYPFVMGENAYPYSYPETSEGKAAQRAWEMYLPDATGNRFYKACIVTAKVVVPASLKIPPLSVRHKGRLVFPTGTIKGTWCGCELENAVKHGCTVVKVYDCAAWVQTSYYFTGWVEKMAERKCNTEGAERAFYKLLQNSLYGKFAQRRTQTDVAEWTPELDVKLRARHAVNYVRCTEVGMLVEYEVTRFASFMQPHIAAHITAFARVLLYDAMMTEQDRGNVVVYTDTDSLVTTQRMDAETVGPTEYGLWKLEREVGRGLYVSPKLYAEVDPEGCEILKGKGLLRSYRDSLSFSSYESIMARLVCGESIIELYSGIPNRRRFLRAILANGDVDEPRFESKSIHADTWQKRQIDWESGETKAWDMTALKRRTHGKHSL